MRMRIVGFVPDTSGMCLMVVSVLVLGQLVSSWSLSIVAEGVLEGEAVVVAIRLLVSVVKRMVVVSYSWNVIWVVAHIRILNLILILGLGVIEPLSWIIKIKPVGALFRWCIGYFVSLPSLS